MSALVYPPASNLATSHSRGVSGGDGSTAGVNVARSSGVSEHQPRDARLPPPLQRRAQRRQHDGAGHQHVVFHDQRQRPPHGFGAQFLPHEIARDALILEGEEHRAVQRLGRPEQDELALGAQGAQVAHERDRRPVNEVGVHEHRRGVASGQDAERLRRMDVVGDPHGGQGGQGIAQRIPLAMRGADERERQNRLHANRLSGSGWGDARRVEGPAACPLL